MCVCGRKGVYACVMDNQGCLANACTCTCTSSLLGRAYTYTGSYSRSNTLQIYSTCLEATTADKYMYLVHARTYRYGHYEGTSEQLSPRLHVAYPKEDGNAGDFLLRDSSQLRGRAILGVQGRRGS